MDFDGYFEGSVRKGSCPNACTLRSSPVGGRHWGALVFSLTETKRRGEVIGKIQKGRVTDSSTSHVRYMYMTHDAGAQLSYSTTVLYCIKLVVAPLRSNLAHVSSLGTYTLYSALQYQ